MLETAKPVHFDPNDLVRLIPFVTEQVLESLCFTAIQEAVEQPPEEPCYTTRVRYFGGASGVVWLRLGKAAAAGVAENFLGVDASPSEAHTTSVLRELNNMVCGSLLSQLCSDGLFSLDAPQVAHEEEWPPEGAIFKSYLVDRGALTVAVQLATD